MARDVRRTLTPEERNEYERLVYDATHNDDGTARASSQIGPELHRLLVDAEQAHREWATWVREDAEISGLREVGKKWMREKEVITTRIGTRTVTKPAAYAIRKQSASGKSAFQPTLWPDMTGVELKQLVASAGVRINAERDTIATARRLLDLIEQTGAEPVSVALERIGMSLEEFLDQENAA